MTFRFPTLTAIFCLLFLAQSSIFAQRGWEAGGWGGVSYYFGDLNTSYDLSKPNAAAGAIARFNLNERIAIRFGLNYGKVGANDADSKNAFERQRNLNFNTILVDGFAGAEFNFLPLVHGSYDKFFTPYLVGGVAAFYSNPKTDLNGTTYALRNYGTEGQFKGEEYYSIQPALVYGGGIKYSFNDHWCLNVEVTGRRLYSDYLDDVSTVYPDMNALRNLRGQIAVDLSNRTLPNADGTRPSNVTGTQRGDSKSRDTYAFVGVGMVYYFGSLLCPPISRR